MHYAATKRNHDGHLTFYVLLSGLREYQKFLFYFSRHPALCIYLYPSPPPTPKWIRGHLGHWTRNNQTEEELQ